MVIGAGLVCALLIVYRLLDPPGLATAADTAATETGRRLGPFFALLATASMTWGAWRAIEDGAIEDKPFEVAKAPTAEAPTAPEPEPEPGPEPEPSRSRSQSRRRHPFRLRVGRLAHRYDRPAWPRSTM